MRLPSAAIRRTLRSVPVLLAGLALQTLFAGAASALPPANDNLSNAVTVNPAALPYSDSVTINEATQEGGEPFPCAFSFQTIWYRITPTSDVWLVASESGIGFNVNVYKDTGGFGFSGLQFVNCTSFGGQALVLARAGSTYFFQACAQCCAVQGTLAFSLQQVPPPAPTVTFFFNPGDPSAFDRVQFFENSFDPGQQGIRSRLYDFGDGATDTTCCPQHLFAADGDYTVKLTVTTTDGRSGSSTHPVSVRTHDVTVTNFKVPQSGNVGQTKLLTVSVSNTRYPEVVRVQLQKAVPGSFFGYETIGSLEQFVQVRGGNRATDFSFSYTFTPDDAAIGKVTLQALAELEGTRDALAADNEAVSPPIRVGRSGGRTSTAGLDVNADAGEDDFAPLGVSPNPARAGADLAIRLALPEAGEASIQVLDVAGRVMASSDLGRLEAGVHDARVTWRQRPAPGIYWVRIAQFGRTSRMLRVAVLE